MTRVKSSNIAGVDYDQAHRILIVRFTNDTIYRYWDVPQARYAGLLRAKSKGKYFAKHIKLAHKYKKLDDA